MLRQGKEVLNGKIYSYSRGETSLLEVLNAQRTYNDLQTSYYETLYNCNAALVELQRSVGVWDIDF
jgi:cobalt-zinc-cadmium efflux system outer membrane protein